MTSLTTAMPLAGLAGGLMIGLAAAILLLGAGRIAGISGLFARASGISQSGMPWVPAVVFIAALLAGALMVKLISGDVVARYPDSLPLLTVGGLLVGFGTRLGSGCTSGHGVCGLSRLSRRSLVATSLFIVAGLVTVTIMNLAGIT